MLEGKIALVTGASRGIGHAIAQALKESGATVIGTSTSEEGAKKVPGTGRVLDVRDAAQCDALIESVQKDVGDIAIQPQYFIEYMGEAPSWPRCDSELPQHPSCLKPRYRVTARSTAADRAQVVLQSNLAGS